MTEQLWPDHQTAPAVDETPPASTSRRLPGRTMWWLIGGGALAIVVAIVVTLSLVGGGRDLTVKFALIDLDGVSCAGGTGGYNDVGPGMSVVVRNNDGQVIGTGSLGDNGEKIESVACEWTALVEDVPSGEDYYAVTVGRRGEQVYTGDELEEQNWEISLSLGGP